MLFAFPFDIDKNVIKIHYHKNIKLLCQNLVDIILECERYIGQSKRHDLVLKMAITGSEGCFPFIAYSDLHLVVGISQIGLSEMSSLT